MSDVTLDHFKRATADIGANGDNDTLPFDIDVRFINEKQEQLAELAYAYFEYLDDLPKKDAKPHNVRDTINSLEVFSERLLVPTGAAGFRIRGSVHIAEKSDTSTKPARNGVFSCTKNRIYYEFFDSGAA